MPVVVDDHLLLELLAAGRALDLGPESSEVYTTGSWYYRLARAVLSGTGTGSISGRLAVMDEGAQRRAVESLLRMPDGIGLLGHRTVVPVMATLRAARPANLLTAEALAVALVVGGGLRVAVDSDLLRENAEALRLDYEVVALA